jgi:hypothetical protein
LAARDFRIAFLEDLRRGTDNLVFRASWPAHPGRREPVNLDTEACKVKRGAGFPGVCAPLDWATSDE